MMIYSVIELFTCEALLIDICYSLMLCSAVAAPSAAAVVIDRNTGSYY